MIVLITNDDGIEADGLAALRRAVSQQLLAEIYTVAPAGAMSLVGHRVTTHDPIKIEERGERSWAVHGTPADCVRVAIAKLMPVQPDWVFSGINHGGNLGQDTYISGTVAAAREAAYHGLRAAAFSHYMRRGVHLDWDVAARRVALVLQHLLDEDLKPGEHWNVNLPHLDPDDEDEPSLMRTEPEPAPLGIGYEQAEGGLLYNSAYFERQRQPGSDVDVCFGGEISVSKLEIHGFKRTAAWMLKSRDLATQAKMLVRGWDQIAKPQGHPDYFEWDGPIPPFDGSATAEFSEVNAWWLAELSRIVYTRCAGEVLWRGEDPVRAERLKKAGIQQLRSWYSAGSHAAIFQLAYTRTGEPATVVCFRGTNNLLQWVLNLTVLGEPWDDPDTDAKVHQGFKYIFDELWPNVEQALPDGPVFFAGHSLGGGLAVLAATRRKPAAIYTFGAPRSGNQAFVNLLGTTPHHRLVYHHDIVSILPQTRGKRSGLVYRHSGRLHYLTEDYRLIVGDGHSDLGDESWKPESPAKFLRDAIEAAGANPPQPLLDHSPINYTRALRARILRLPAV